MNKLLKPDTYHDAASSRSVVGVIQGTHFGLSLVFEVQLHTLDAHVSAPCGEVKEVLKKSKFGLVKSNNDRLNC